MFLLNLMAPLNLKNLLLQKCLTILLYGDKNPIAYYFIHVKKQWIIHSK